MPTCWCDVETGFRLPLLVSASDSTSDIGVIEMVIAGLPPRPDFDEERSKAEPFNRDGAIGLFEGGDPNLILDQDESKTDDVDDLML